jgi:oligopeptide transport system substrate-binding protein
MSRRWAPLRGVTMGVAIAVVACTASEPPPPSTLRVDADAVLTTALGGNSTFLTWDPAKTEAAPAIEQVLMVYEPLLRFDPVTLRPVAGAARDLPSISPDGLRYRLTLRDGLVFSDRVPVRAQDFAYGLSRFCDPTIGSPYAAAAFAINGCADWAAMAPTAAPDVLAGGSRRLMNEGIRVLSDRELEIVLREPASYFSSILGLWLAVPIRQQDVERGGVNWWSDPATLVGNGSFVLQEFTPGERIVFKRSETARIPAKVRTWTKLLIEEPFADKILDAYRAGTLDYMGVSGAQLATVANDAVLRADLQVVDSGTTTHIKLNLARAPFDDANVRLAFAKSIDREAYTKELRPFARVATSFIPPGVPGHDPDDTVQRFDPQAARELLGQSRYAGSLPKPLIWNYRADRPAAGVLAKWFADQWRQHLGVDIELRAVTLTQLQADLRAIETTPHFEHGTWIMDYPHQHNWLSHFFGFDGLITAFNGYRNADVGELLRSADRETNERTRDALYLRAARTISSEAANIWLAYLPSALVVRPRVRSLYLSAFDSGGFWRPGEVYVSAP